MLRNLSPRYLLALLLADTLIVTLGLLLAWYVRLNLQFGAYAPEGALSPPWWLFGVGGVSWMVGLWQGQVYRPQTNIRIYIRRLMVGHGIGALLFLGTVYVTYRDLSRLQAFYVVALVFGGLLLHRMLLWYFADPVSERRRVLIIGVDDHARRVGDKVAEYAWANLALVGYMRPDGAAATASIPPEQLCGGLDDLEAIVTQAQVDEVVICVQWFDWTVFAEVAQIVRTLQNQPVNIRLAPDYTDLAYFHLSAEDFGGTPLIGVRYDILSPVQRVVKRLADVLVAAGVLLVCWPLFLLIIVAIRLDSPGPALFSQTRIGQYGRPFKMLKFRTMYTTEPPRSVQRKRPDDPRVTRAGRFLRRTSLDELPQFINVLRGEMSVVGPRPELPEFVEKYEWWQRKRFELPQGITGWWQINGRADRPMFENTEDDLYYISHYSLALDMQIILRTLLVVFTGRGAY